MNKFLLGTVVVLATFLSVNPAAAERKYFLEGLEITIPDTWFDMTTSNEASSCGILPSTTRGFIVDELAAARRPAREDTLSPEDLESASEVIITSSVSGIRPLRALDGRPLPEASPVAEWLEARYEAIDGGF